MTWYRNLKTAVFPERFDALVLLLFLLISIAPHLCGLGFYSDDWAFLAIARAPGSTLIGTFKALWMENRMRPIGDLTRTIQLWTFGDHPLGYHVFNSVMIAAVCFLFWKLLRRLRVSRDAALASALIYGVLPHFSTLRFWFASGIANISLAFFFISAISDMHAVEQAGIRKAALRLISLAGIIVSLLSYELVLPLFFVWSLFGMRWAQRERTRNLPTTVLWGNIVVLALVVAFKASIPDRLGTFSADPLGLLRWIVRTLFDGNYGPGNSGLNVFYLFRTNIFTYGVLLPLSVWKIMARRFDLAVISVSVVLGCLSAAGVLLAARDERIDNRTAPLVRLGLIVFVLGYAIFLTNGNIQLSPTGTGNRTAGVAGLGVALVIVGLARLASRRLSRRRPSPIFAMLIAVCVCLFYVITGTLGTMWVDAYRKESRLLVQMKSDVQRLPSGATLLLDGVCRYIGPAPVFEACWDLQGAVQLIYHDPTLHADIVNPTLQLLPDGLRTAEYDSPTIYPYDGLIIYNARLRKTFLISDRVDAELYFSKINSDLSNGCPPGFGGWGEKVF